MYKAVDYPHWCQAWKQAAKKYYAKFIEDEYFNKWIHAEALAAERLELLKRCKFIIDVCGVDWKDMTERFDSTLFDELAAELGEQPADTGEGVEDDD